MKLKNRTLFISILLIFVIGIISAKSIGAWQTESNKIPAKIRDGIYAGEYDPEDIRGSYYFSDIVKYFDISEEVLAEAFGLKGDISNMKLKDLEALYENIVIDGEIGTGSVKYFVALYKGLQYESLDNLPKSAVDLLSEEGKISLIEKDILNQITIDLSNEANEENNTEDDECDEEFNVNGNTTINDLISNGILLGDIENLLNMKLDNKNFLLRDLCREKGLSFSTVKDTINQWLIEE